MKEISDNGIFEQQLREILKSRQVEPSPELWGKISHQLFKKDVVDFATLRKFKRTFQQGHLVSVSTKIKTLAIYASAACLIVGFVYGSTIAINSLVKNFNQNKALIPEPENIPGQSNSEKAVSMDTTETLAEISESGEMNSVNTNSIKTLQNTGGNITKNIDKLPEQNSIIPDEASDNKIIDNKLPEAITSLNNYIERLNASESNTSVKAIENEQNEVTELIASSENSTENNNFPDEMIEYKISIPNVITPNGDGFNDFLVISNLDKFPENSLIIADRNGKVVYDKTSYQNDWQAQNLIDGTYYYILTYKSGNSLKNYIKGVITIIR